MNKLLTAVGILIILFLTSCEGGVTKNDNNSLFSSQSETSPAPATENWARQSKQQMVWMDKWEIKTLSSPWEEIKSFKLQQPGTDAYAHKISYSDGKYCITDHRNVIIYDEKTGSSQKVDTNGGFVVNLVSSGGYLYVIEQASYQQYKDGIYTLLEIFYIKDGIIKITQQELEFRAVGELFKIGDKLYLKGMSFYQEPAYRTYQDECRLYEIDIADNNAPFITNRSLKLQTEQEYIGVMQAMGNRLIIMNNFQESGFRLFVVDSDSFQVTEYRLADIEPSKRPYCLSDMVVMEDKIILAGIKWNEAPCTEFEFDGCHQPPGRLYIITVSTNELKTEKIIELGFNPFVLMKDENSLVIFGYNVKQRFFY